jgi:hypothetical protein
MRAQPRSRARSNAASTSADARRRVAGEEEIRVGVAQQAPHAGLECGVAGLVPLPPVAEADHEPRDVRGVLLGRKPDHVT